MKSAIVLLTLALCANGIAARSLQQNLPTLSGSSKSAAPAPSPIGNSCVLGLLESSSNFTTLLSLVQAASEANILESLLGSSTEQATVFAPTNAGISSALSSQGMTAQSVLSNPSLITSILQYHISPSQLRPADLQSGYSFNTLYEVNNGTANVAQSVAIQGNGVSATVVGAKTSAAIISEQTVCQFIVYPINGLLLF